MEHYVAPDDYDADAERQILGRVDLDAPTWILVWRRFKRHRLGVICFFFLAIGYALLPFVQVIAPYTPNRYNENQIYSPPQGLYLFHDGRYAGLHTYDTMTVYDQETGL
ncbi:MAG: ABC transporter permease, partial [Pseudomonadota bacterium]